MLGTFLIEPDDESMKSAFYAIGISHETYLQCTMRGIPLVDGGIYARVDNV